MKNKKLLIKYSIITIGDSQAGKTSLISRYVSDTFEEAMLPTMGFDYFEKKKEIDGNNYCFSLMDTTGQEKYASLGVQYFRNADGAIFVYEVTKRKSYENIENWMAKVNEYCDRDMPYVVFQNKCDEPKEKWEVSDEDREELKKKINREIHFVSAKSGENVNEAFLDIEKKIIEANKEKECKVRVKISKDKNKRSKCC